MGKRGKETVIALFLVLAAFSPLYLHSADCRPLGPMDPTVWVETDRDSYTLNVEPGHAEEITIHGTAYCEFTKGTPPGTKVYLDLEITSNIDYKGSVMHTFIKGKEEDPVDFSIDVPDMTGESAEIEHKMTMFPNWYNPAANRQGMGDPHSITINALPYGAVLMINPGPQKFNVGEFHEVELEIKNRGNARDEFNVRIDAGELELALPAEILVIDQGRVGVYSFLVKQDSGLGTTGTIGIEVSSETSGDLDTDQVEIHYETRSKVSSFLLRPIPLMISVALLVIITIAVVLVVKKIRNYRSSI